MKAKLFLPVVLFALGVSSFSTKARASEDGVLSADCLNTIESIMVNPAYAGNSNVQTYLENLIYQLQRYDENAGAADQAVRPSSEDGIAQTVDALRTQISSIELFDLNMACQLGY